MRVSRSPFLAGAMLIAATGPAAAVDRWETVSLVAPVGDDDSSTINEPMHGAVQVGHDFDSASDQDWMKVLARARRSYQARVWSGGMPWQSPACPPGACASFDLVTQGGAVIMAGAPEGVNSGALSIGWASGDLDEVFYMRAQSSTGLAGFTYDLGFYDTTMLVPRFNNVGTQTTVLILQNARPYAVAGFIHFYDAAGTHLHAYTLSVPGNGTLALATGTIPALQNVSGSAQIAHTAGYGGLAGKAVALEPSTGYAFDTPMTPVPY